MSVRALTFDFWNTLAVAAHNGAPRQAQRLSVLKTIVHTYQPDCPQATLEAAYEATVRRFYHLWKTEHHTPKTTQLIDYLWQTLELDVAPHHHEQIVTVFERGILEHPPAFTDGIHDVLAWASARYPLAIISDTMFSPGTVIRELLDQEGILAHFTGFVFSDETGVSKPEVKAFAYAADALGVNANELIHMGDLRRTDIGGAQAVGAQGFLYTGHHTDTRHPEIIPNQVFNTWAELPRLLAETS